MIDNSPSADKPTSAETTDAAVPTVKLCRRCKERPVEGNPAAHRPPIYCGPCREDMKRLGRAKAKRKAVARTAAWRLHRAEGQGFHQLTHAPAAGGLEMDTCRETPEEAEAERLARVEIYRRQLERPNGRIDYARCAFERRHVLALMAG